ncbi:hypothetical protein TNCV_689691 [Trichonephila clavipes]|nr:hypothetical protein TNCV_689691 [Trichonephila clavipes]
MWRNFVSPEGRQMALLVIQLVCGLVVKSTSWFRTIEMVRLLENWSRLEVRAVIRFLWAKNVSVSAMSRPHVVKLCHSFQSDREDVESHNMTETAGQVLQRQKSPRDELQK